MILLVSAAIAVAPPDLDWHRPGDRVKMHQAFDHFAEVCAGGFGFTRPTALTSDTMSAKIEAQLLLSSSPQSTLEAWAAPMATGQAVQAEGKSKEVADRGADAILAAIADPDTFQQSEDLYVDTIMGLMDRLLGACTTFAQDGFLGKYYLTGIGNNGAFREKAKADFAAAVAEMKDYKASLKPKKR